jgi:hypothetical protein
MKQYTNVLIFNTLNCDYSRNKCCSLFNECICNGPMFLCSRSPGELLLGKPNVSLVPALTPPRLLPSNTLSVPSESQEQQVRPYLIYLGIYSRETNHKNIFGQVRIFLTIGRGELKVQVEGQIVV